MKLDFKKINFKQPKYMIPLLALLPLVFIGYQVIEAINFEPEETDKPKVTQSVNTDLPEVNETPGTETKTKYQAMLDGFGAVTDYTAVEGTEKEEDKKIEVSSVYKDEERRRIDSMMLVQSKQAEMLKKQLEMQQKQWQEGQSNVISRKQALAEGKVRDNEEAERYDQLVKQMQLVQKVAKGEKILSEEEQKEEERRRLLAEEKARLLDSIAQAQGPVAVNKAGDAGEAHFNTVTESDGMPSLIKARVDRVEKVRDGSRIRLRLSEDIEIEGDVLKKGAYLYATVTGFSAQRVKANVTSVMVGNQIKKIDLAVYDLDGMEGFYVPSSNFREMSRDIGANTLSMNMNINQGGGQDLQSMAMQSLQQALQGTTQAVSKNIRQNRARIKFNTNIYLVDTSSK